MKDLVRLSPSGFDLEASFVEKSCAVVLALPVTTQAELDDLGVGLKEAHARLTWLEGHRTARTAAPLAEVERIRAETRGAEAAYKKLKAAINARTVRYHQETREAAAVARAAALATQEQAHAAAVAGAPQAAAALQTTAFRHMQSAPVAMSTDGVHTRKEWRVRVTDAALVPRNFLVPDEAAILEAVRVALPKPSAVGGVVPELARTGWASNGIEIYLHETAVPHAR